MLEEKKAKSMIFSVTISPPESQSPHYPPHSPPPPPSPPPPSPPTPPLSPPPPAHILLDPPQVKPG